MNNIQSFLEIFNHNDNEITIIIEHWFNMYLVYNGARPAYLTLYNTIFKIRLIDTLMELYKDCRFKIISANDYVFIYIQPLPINTFIDIQTYFGNILGYICPENPEKLKYNGAKGVKYRLKTPYTKFSIVIHSELFLFEHKQHIDIKGKLYDIIAKKIGWSVHCDYNKEFINNKIPSSHDIIKYKMMDEIENILDLNTIDIYGHTPISYTIKYNHLDIVKILLNYGANIHMGNVDLKNVDIDIVKLLVAY